MNNRRMCAWPVPMIGIVIVLSGIACGKGRPAAIDAAFVAKANDVCAAALARRPETPPPLPVESFDPRHPKPEHLPPIGAHFSRFNSGEQVASELATLGEPTNGAAEWRALVALARRSAKNSTAQIDAAKASDVASFVRFVEEGEAIAGEFRRVGPAAGFDSSSACAKYYTG